jgi:hypothetical protein
MQKVIGSIPIGSTISIDNIAGELYTSIMQVETANSVLGWWSGNRLAIETRRVYNYETGNDVTVVERRFINVQVYDARGQMEPALKGQNIDLMI